MKDALVARLFPAMLLLFNVGAAVMALSHRDWQRGVYWLASAVCIGCVAWLPAPLKRITKLSGRRE